MKVRMSKHGYFQVADATAYEKTVEMVEEEVPQVEQPKTEEQTAPSNMETEETGENAGEKKADDASKTDNAGDIDAVKTAPKKETVMKEKVRTKSYDLKIEHVEVPGELSDTALRDFIEKENSIQSQNKMERDRVDCKNSLEEYTLNINRDINEHLQQFTSEQEYKVLSEMCEFINNWLYDEGEDQPKSVYAERLSQLTVVGDPIKRRHYENQYRQQSFDRLATTVMHFRKIVDSYNNKDDKYAHIEAAEMEKVEKAVQEKQTWFDEKQQKQMQKKIFEDPVVTSEQIVKEAEYLERLCNPIVSRSKPAPPKPPTPPAADGKAKPTDANGAEQPPAKENENGAATAEQNGMELD